MDAVYVLWEALRSLGSAIVGIIRSFIDLLGLQVPDWVVELATIIALVIVVFRYGKFIGIIFIVILLIMLASIFIQLLIP